MLDVDEVVSAHVDPSVQSTHWDTCHLAHKVCAILALAHEVERLRGELDRAHDARIEAQNPGIDMDEVRLQRAERRAGVVQCKSCGRSVRAITHGPCPSHLLLGDDGFPTGETAFLDER